MTISAIIRMRRIVCVSILAGLAYSTCAEAASPDAQARGVERSSLGAPTPPRDAKRIALCIGIDHYDCVGYPPLQYAGADAKDLGAKLAQLGYEVTVMTDDAA